jgi:hypothetical protein
LSVTRAQFQLFSTIAFNRIGLQEFSFVIALHGASIQVSHQIQHAESVGTAPNQISHEYYTVVFADGCDCQQVSQFGKAPVNITND